MTMEWPGFQGGPMPDAFDDLMQGALIESPRGVGPLPSAEESAIVGATAARIGAGEIVAMPLVHRLLRSVAAGVAQRPDALSVRASASPFTPFDGTHCSYLVSRSVFSALQKEREPAEDEDANAVKGAAPSVSVAFQSALNGEQWWSPEDPSVGIVARPMARRARTGSGAGQLHGYRGRQYTLVTRTDYGLPAADKSVDVGLVQIWRDDEAMGRRNAAVAPGPPAQGAKPAASEGKGKNNARKRAKVRCVDKDDESDTDASRDSRSGASFRSASPASTVTSPPNGGDFATAQGASSSASPAWAPRALEPLAPGGPPAAAMRRFQRSSSEPLERMDTVDHDTRFTKDIYVEGTIHGVVRAPVEAADYAEWFMWQEELLEREALLPPPGSVVCLRTLDQTLSLETHHQDGPCLIVSTRPSIAAGVPADDVDRRSGALVAFLGQVPLRCVGRVDCGDQLVPSGRHDGTAVSARHAKHARWMKTTKHDILGVALSSGGAEAPSPTKGGGDLETPKEEAEHTILCFVRWNQAVAREVNVIVDDVVKASTSGMSTVVFWTSLVLVGATLILGGHISLRAVNGRRHPSDRYLQIGKKYAWYSTFISLIIALDHVCLYILMAIYGRAMPHLSVIFVEWLVGFATLPIVWAYWSVVNRVLVYAFAFYLVVLRISYYIVLIHSAYVIRRDAVAPEGIASWKRLLPPRCKKLGSRLWAPVIILLVFVYCLMTDDSVYIEK